jgi:exopolysaccharide production protein ExoY
LLPDGCTRRAIAHAVKACGDRRGARHIASAPRDGTAEGERVIVGVPSDGETRDVSTWRSRTLLAATVRKARPWRAGREAPGRLAVERYRLIYGSKRVVDVLVSLVLGVIGLPLFAVIALLIRLESPGSPIYWQQRYGKQGRRFRCYKFRSMYRNADARLTTILATDPHLRDEYARYHKLRHDPRISRVGWILRRFSLDELPQFWNVFIGDMSIVGPRPYDVTELALECESQRVILAVRPGLTGLWQISGRNTRTFAERLALDRTYVRAWSPSLELKILCQTLPAVLFGHGAF